MIHKLGDAFRSAVSSVTPVGTTSKFIEAGTLTPDEFLLAGEQLAFKFPTWQWEAGDASKRANYLPNDKQFLITRNVPCKDRVRALDIVLERETRSEGEWLLPGTDAVAEGELKDVDDLVDEPERDAKGPLIVAQEDFLDNAGEDMPDFSALDATLAEEDPAAQSAEAAKSPGYFVADAPDEHVIKIRTYDLSITYDKYYQTPRLWLFGYDENGVPLKPELVYEDVLSEYVAKTVTVDPHPLTGTPTVSIHPCKHALVMKKVVQDWIKDGITPRTDLALFVFLKFISGVVPTINYDFTMDIEF